MQLIEREELKYDEEKIFCSGSSMCDGNELVYRLCMK